MCGISGFSLTKCDAKKIDSRILARCLLKNIEHRGRHATGASWTETMDEGLMWWYTKAPIPASEFDGHLEQMPKHTRRALLHVRYATTGDPEDENNNHPIIVPSSSGGSVIGVHNGIINNYQQIMDDIGADWIGEVDSQALFHLAGTEDFTKEKFRQVQGSASIAYVDTAEPTTIKLVRMSMRPLWIAQTEDGSTLWSSEKDALLDAMSVVGLTADFVMEVPEWTMVTINDARLDSVEQIVRPTALSGQMVMFQ